MVCQFLGKVYCFRIPGGISIEPKGTVLSWVGQVHPWRDGLEGVFSQLFRKFSESPLFRLCRLESFQLFKEVAFKCMDVGV